MSGEIVVDVYLNAIKGTPKPSSGSILYSFKMDSYNGKGDVFVARNGDIYVGDSKEDDITIRYVLQTHQLVWNGTAFKTSLDADLAQNQTPADMLWITRLAGKPSGKWPSGQPEFDEVKVPNPGSKDAVEVNLHRKTLKQTDFPYGLAVNVYDSTGNHAGLVRDDPMIRDRGVPSMAQFNPLPWLIGGAVAGVLVTYLITRFVWKRSASDHGSNVGNG